MRFFTRVVGLRARNLLLSLTDTGDAAARGEMQAAIETEATDLFERFVASGSEEQVNLPGSMFSSATKWEDMKMEARVSLLNRAADETLRMMAMDCFPRYLQSGCCTSLLDDLKGDHSVDDADKAQEAAALTTLNAMRAKAPRSRSEWIARLSSVAQVLPVCVVITDMKAPDQPLCFVNDFFWCVGRAGTA